jgi:sulfite reductase alpha subunit-like flavoprotein
VLHYCAFGSIFNTYLLGYIPYQYAVPPGGGGGVATLKMENKLSKQMLQALAGAVKDLFTVNRELHASASDRTCRIIKFDLKGKGVRYSTGGHIAILNRNRFAPPNNRYRSCSP